MRVLTVDDSRTILAMLHHTLSNAGFEVLQAEDGQKGLEVLKNESVDVVITDINMPVMDGIEFIRNVRSTGLHNSLPILILTTETNQDKREQGRRRRHRLDRQAVRPREADLGDPQGRALGNVVPHPEG